MPSDAEQVKACKLVGKLCCCNWDTQLSMDLQQEVWLLITLPHSFTTSVMLGKTSGQTEPDSKTNLKIRKSFVEQIGPNHIEKAFHMVFVILNFQDVQVLYFLFIYYFQFSR